MQKNMFNEVSIAIRGDKFYNSDISVLSIQLPRQQIKNAGIQPKQLIEFSINDKKLFLKLSNEKKKGDYSGYLTQSYQINIPMRKLTALNQFILPESCIRVGFVIIDDSMVIDLSRFQEKETFAQLAQEPKPEVKRIVSFAGLKC
jgi:hypothetical protein